MGLFTIQTTSQKKIYKQGYLISSIVAALGYSETTTVKHMLLIQSLNGINKDSSATSIKTRLFSKMLDRLNLVWVRVHAILLDLQKYESQMKWSARTCSCSLESRSKTIQERRVKNNGHLLILLITGVELLVLQEVLKMLDEQFSISSLEKNQTQKQNKKNELLVETARYIPQGNQVIHEL